MEVMLAPFVMSFLALPALAQSVPAPVAVSPIALSYASAPITPELLARWSIPLDKYMAMTPERKTQLRDDLDAGERARLRRIDLIQRFADKRRASGKTAPQTVILELDGARSLGGTSIWNEKNGDLRIVLSAPRDQGDADFRLRGLESYLK